MAMKERYYTVDGQMIGYETGTARKDFLTDALGSVTAEVDQTGNTKTFDGRYKPYGGDFSSIGIRGSFGWVGAWGYKDTGLTYVSHYIRSRHYSKSSGSWSSADLLWPMEKAYVYVNGRAVAMMDYFGAFPEKLNKPKPKSVAPACVCGVKPPVVRNVPCPTCTIGPPPKAGVGNWPDLGTRQSCYQEACEVTCLIRDYFDDTIASCVKDPSILKYYPICRPSSPNFNECNQYCGRRPGLTNIGTGCGESDPMHPGHPLFNGLFGLFNCAEECQKRICCKMGDGDKKATDLWNQQIKECNRLYNWKRSK